jgi:hypothetical protein
MLWAVGEMIVIKDGQKKFVFNGCVIAAILFPTLAIADCVDGLRKATPREAAFFQNVQDKLKDALPAPPPGWTVAPERNPTLGGLCTGTPEGSFAVRVAAKYTYRFPKEEADQRYAEGRKVQGEIDALEKLPPEVAKERQGWMDKYSEATRAARQADKDGNKDLARQKYTERDGYDKKASEVRAKYLASVKSRVDALRVKMAALNYAPQDVMIQISVNEMYPEKIDQSQASEIVIGKVPVQGSFALKVHDVRMILKGPAPKREELRSAVEKARLERLLHYEEHR